MMFGLAPILYLMFAVPALFGLRKRDLDEVSRAIWTIPIVAIPILGPVAFAIVAPGLPSR